MSDLPPGLHPGHHVSIVLADGTVLTGILEKGRKGWVRLRGDGGLCLVNLAHAALIRPLGGVLLEAEEDADDDEGTPKPRAVPRPAIAGPTAPGRAWADDDLRAIADALLDGETDLDLAARFHRTKGAIKDLRQGFECARGNLVEEEISPVARTWVPRLRAVLAG